MKKSEYMKIINEDKKSEMDVLRKSVSGIMRFSKRYPKLVLEELLWIMKQFCEWYQIYLECEDD